MTFEDGIKEGERRERERIVGALELAAKAVPHGGSSETERTVRTSVRRCLEQLVTSLR